MMGYFMGNKVNGEGQSLPDSSDETVRSELQEYLDVWRQRRQTLPRAALVGAGAGITALLFRVALTSMDALL